jgi:hypothetical protein
MAHAGRLNIKIHKADITTESVHCAVKLPQYGALCTSPAASQPSCTFEEDLSFDMGPIDDKNDCSAQFIVYKTGGGDSKGQELGRGAVELKDVYAEEPKRVAVCIYVAVIACAAYTF